MNNNPREKIYLKIIEWGVYLSLFTPLILVKSFYFPYVVPKTIFFRIIVDVILIAYILLLISNSKYRPRFNRLTLSVTMFLAITFLASVFGINFAKSFWSVFERMTGLLTFFHLYAFFIILTSVFRKRKIWDKILTVSVLVGVLVSLYNFSAADSSANSGATLGNVSFLAAYLIFNIFFSIIFIFTKKGIWRFLFLASLAIMLLTLCLAAELPRGALGAFIIGIALMVFGYMIFSGNRKLKIAAPIVLVSFSLIMAIISQTNYFKEELVDLRDIPGEARAIVWQTGIDAWQERPLLGWGPENFNAAFVKYFNPKLPVTGDLWYDRVHNVVIDTMVDSGIVGLISYLSVFVVAFIGLLKICPRVAEKRNLLIPLGMTSLLLVYLIQNLWVFDMVSSYMIFFLTLAFINFLIEGEKEEDICLDKKNGLNPFIGASVIVVSLLTIYFGNIQPARASHYTVLGIGRPIEAAIPLFQKALAIAPMSNVETVEQFSRKVNDSVFDENVDGTALRNGFVIAEAEVKKSIEKNPFSLRLYLVLGRQYNSFFSLTGDPEILTKAENIINEGMKISSNNQQMYWTLAQTKIYQGEKEEAINIMQQAVDLDPNFLVSRWYLAMTYKVFGENELALEEIEEAEAAGFIWKTDPERLGRVIEIYQSLQNDDKLIEVYPLAIQMNPQNAQFQAGLAVAYANTGQFDKAREWANKALELNPDFKDEIELFLSQLP